MEKVMFQLIHTIDSGLQTLAQCFPHSKKPEVAKKRRQPRDSDQSLMNVGGHT